MTMLTMEQKYQRLKELFTHSRQRCLADGGNPQKSASGNTYLTPDEQQEFLIIARSLESQKHQ